MKKNLIIFLATIILAALICWYFMPFKMFGNGIEILSNYDNNKSEAIVLSEAQTTTLTDAIRNMKCRRIIGGSSKDAGLISIKVLKAGSGNSEVIEIVLCEHDSYVLRNSKVYYIEDDSVIKDLL